MKTRKKIIALGLAASLVLSGVGCSGTSTSETSSEAGAAESTAAQEEAYKIGVAIYNLEDEEVLMFRNYYEEYLENAFHVDFVYSHPLKDTEDEKAFVDSAKEEGCGGIISFITYDLEAIVDYCGEDLYYMMGSGTLSEDQFNAVKDKENFLGIIGPSIANEKDAGVHMIEALAGDDGAKKDYVLLSGGAAVGNFMHRERLIGMLETLEKAGFTLEKTTEELADSTEVTLAATNADGKKVYINPGYLDVETYKTNMDEILAQTEVDVVASTYFISSYIDEISAEEAAQNKDIATGAVDCFSDSNQEAFLEKDAFGNSKLNYIEGKCAAMAIPAFVAMYNAVSGHLQTVRNGEEAFWLNQNFWSADSAQTYEELSAAAENVYENIYGTKDIMNVLAEYTEDADYDDFVEFVGKIS